MGGPRQPDPGAAQHVDKVGDTQDVLRRLKGRVPTPQDQHILTLEVLGVHGHRLVPLHVLGAWEVNLVGDRQTGGHEKHAAGRGQMEDPDVKMTPCTCHLATPPSPGCRLLKKPEKLRSFIRLLTYPRISDRLFPLAPPRPTPVDGLLSHALG